jgi:transposase-like protein
VSTVSSRPHYSDEERAACLAALEANGFNFKKTARECGVPRPTLIRWAKEQAEMDTSPDTPRTPRQEGTAAMLPEARESLAAMFERLAREMLEAVTPEKIQAAPLPYLMNAAGTAVNKMQLLRGEPTRIEERRNDDRQRLFRDRYARSRPARHAFGNPRSDPARQPVHPPTAD